MLVSLLAVTMVGLLAATAFAAGRGGGRGQGQGMRDGACQLSQAEKVTLEGTVTELVLPEPGQRRGQRQQERQGPARFTLAGQGVLLGPPHFLAELAPALKDGEKVKVNGWKVTAEKETYIVAREVIAGGKTYTLRQDDGRPAWVSRGGRGAGGQGRGR
jgi:hypothetical protein